MNVSTEGNFNWKLAVKISSRLFSFERDLNLCGEKSLWIGDQLSLQFPRHNNIPIENHISPLYFPYFEFRLMSFSTPLFREQLNFDLVTRTMPSLWPERQLTKPPVCVYATMFGVFKSLKPLTKRTEKARPVFRGINLRILTRHTAWPENLIPWNLFHLSKNFNYLGVGIDRRRTQVTLLFMGLFKMNLHKLTSESNIVIVIDVNNCKMESMRLEYFR